MRIDLTLEQIRDIINKRLNRKILSVKNGKLVVYVKGWTVSVEDENKSFQSKEELEIYLDSLESELEEIIKFLKSI